jgi:hypothetical protein
MARIARILSMTLLSLSLLAGSASAECARVLWVHGAADSQPYGPEPWDSFRSLEDCKQASSDRVKRFAETQHIGLKLVPVCLPDTVDPRGPKR